MATGGAGAAGKPEQVEAATEGAHPARPSHRKYHWWGRRPENKSVLPGLADWRGSSQQQAKSRTQVMCTLTTFSWPSRAQGLIRRTTALNRLHVVHIQNTLHMQVSLPSPQRTQGTCTAPAHRGGAGRGGAGRGGAGAPRGDRTSKARHLTRNKGVQQRKTKPPIFHINQAKIFTTRYSHKKTGRSN